MINKDRQVDRISIIDKIVRDWSLITGRGGGYKTGGGAREV